MKRTLGQITLGQLLEPLFSNILLGALAIVCLALIPRLQAQNVEGQIIASQYGTWNVPGYAPDTFNFAPTACRVQGGASFFPAFAIGTPVKIVDGNPSRTETVVPTATIENSSECSITISPVNHHEPPFYFTSGTGGLQEAINANVANPGPNTILLNNAWYQLGGSATTIASVHGSAQLGLVDVTQVPAKWYQWNGSHYVAVNPPSAGADTLVNDLISNNSTGNFQDLYHFYATGAVYNTQNAVNAAAANGGAVTIQPGAGRTPFSNPSNVPVVDNRTDVRALAGSLTSWGAACDLRNVYGTLTQNSTKVTILGGFGPVFSSADVGKTLVAVGSVGGVPTAFEPTIAAILDQYDATLSTPSPFTLTPAQQMDLGHDDTGVASGNGGSGIAGALYAQLQYSQQNNLALTVPAGNCLTHTQTSAPQNLVGLGKFLSQITTFPGEDLFQNQDGGQHVQIRDLTLNVDYRIDATQPWNIVNAAGTTLPQTPFYRPLGVQSAYSNNPLGPGWIEGSGPNGGGATNGVAAVTNGSNVITVAAGEVAPVVGEQIVFPYTTPMFTATVASVASQVVTFGSGQNYTGATSTQQEWFAGTSIQNIQTAIPATGRTFPMTITLQNPIQPTPVGESNVAPYGLVKIDGEEFTYVGYSKVSPYTITLQAAVSGAAAAHSIGAVIVPLNPFQPQYPWPITPTVNSGDTTPTTASYYPAWNGGNFAFAFPMVNGSVGPVPMAWFDSDISDLLIQMWPLTEINSVIFPNGTSGSFYFVGLPYSTRFTNLDIYGEYGIAEGVASIENHDYWSAAPTADGTHWTGLSIHTHNSGFAADIIASNQNSYKDFNMYTNGGAGFNLTQGWDDQTGVNNSATTKTTLINMYLEPGAANYPGTGSEPISQWGPLFQWDCDTCTWIGLRVAGAGETYIGGGDQIFQGGNFDTNSLAPVMNYGFGNRFDTEMAGASPNGNVYGVNQFLNWGPSTGNSSTEDVIGASSGPRNIRVSGNSAQPAYGQTNETFNTGNFIAPYVNSQTGYIRPEEFNTAHSFEPNPMSVGWTFDDSAPVSHSYTACDVGTSPGYAYCHTNRFNLSEIAIGPDQRLTDGKYNVFIATKDTPAITQTFEFAVQAVCGSSTTTVLDVYPAVSGTWTSLALGTVDFTPYSGCYMGIIVSAASTTTAEIELAYLDFAPVPQTLGVASSSSTGGISTGCEVSPVTGINSGYTCPGVGWTNTLSAAQGASDTTITLTDSSAGYAPAGCFYVDSETECYTGISGSELTGIRRGQYASTAAAHASSAAATSLDLVLGSPLAAPYAGIASGGTSAPLFFVNNPYPSNHGGASVLSINGGANETYFDLAGGIHQDNGSAYNLLAGETQIGNLGINTPIISSSYLLQSTGPNEAGQPIGFASGIAGPVSSTQAQTIKAPTLSEINIPSGSSSYTYECTGTDQDGNVIPGTPATISGLAASYASPEAVQVSCPLSAGAVTQTIWRTAGGPNQGSLFTGAPPAGIFDFYNGATAGTPPATNTTVPKVCTNGEQFCILSGTSTTPPVTCGTSEEGWEYHDVAANPTHHAYICESGAWTGVY